MTKKEYRDYESRVDAFFEREKIEMISSTGDTNEFSSYRCECCNGLAGARETFVAYVSGSKEKFYFELCQDCTYYLEYGRLDDLTMLEIEDSSERNRK